VHVSEINLREFETAAGRAPDFRALFEGAPGLYVVLDPGFTIVAVSNAWCEATQTARDAILGRNLFDVLLDAAEAGPAGIGLTHLHDSLRLVLEHRTPHRMAMERCEIENGGAIEEHYWRATNTPVVDEAGTVRWIIHAFEDLTETMRACRDETLRLSLLESAHAAAVAG
jgi:PAS domain-containing protein